MKISKKDRAQVLKDLRDLVSRLPVKVKKVKGVKMIPGGKYIKMLKAQGTHPNDMKDHEGKMISHKKIYKVEVEYPYNRLKELNRLIGAYESGGWVEVTEEVKKIRLEFLESEFKIDSDIPGDSSSASLGIE